MLKRNLGVGAAAMLSPLAILLAAAAPAAAPVDQFNRTFAAKGEPAAIHYRVMFRGADGVHHMEVWRDGDRRIKRATDGAIVSYAVRTGDGYKLSVLDMKRRIHTIVDRTNLYRIGQMTDWFDLGHGLRHPVGVYALTPGTAPAGMPAVPGSCRWFDMTTENARSRICWDAAHRLPLLITNGAGRLAWRVTAIDTRAITAATFTIDDRGFIRNNANQDISGD